MIEVKNLSAQYHNTVILKEISFDIKEGEVVTLIGPSGSGKSTILRCINQLHHYNKGSIYFKGKKLLPRYGNQIRKKIGMVFQQFNLFPNMNVLENLIYAPMKVKKKTYAESFKMANAILKLVGLTNKIYEMPNNLSGGQKQRIAIARCLMMEPEVILFDEPTSALDPEVIKEVVDVIESLKNANVTMLIVTHQINFAKKIADRILFIDDGILLENATSKDFFNKPKSHRARLFLENLEL